MNVRFLKIQIRILHQQIRKNPKWILASRFSNQPRLVRLVRLAGFC